MCKHVDRGARSLTRISLQMLVATWLEPDPTKVRALQVPRAGDRERRVVAREARPRPKLDLTPSFRLWIPKTVQRSAFCRSRRELSNAYLLSKFGFDAAENEPYHFVNSSSREFEFELRNFEPLICSPVYCRRRSRARAPPPPTWDR